MKNDFQKYFKIAVTVFILFLCMTYWSSFAHMLGLVLKAASPLFIGCIIAYIVNILMSFYEQHYFPKNQTAFVRKSARPVCMSAAFLSLALILIFVILLIVPELLSCIQLLFAEVPKVMKMLADLLNKFDIVPENIIDYLYNIDWHSTLTKLFQILSNGIGTTVNLAVSALSSFVSSAFNFMIGIIFSIYLLFGKERLLAQCERLFKRYLRQSWNDKMHYVFSVANNCFHHYIVGECTEAVILGSLCALGMLILGIPYAIMTGAVIGVTALIPVAGAYIGGAVGFLLILSVSPVKAVIFVIYLVILQQIEGNLIYPRVVGNSIGLPGLWVLAAVTIGGGVFGIAGMLLGVPLVAVLYQLLRNHLNAEPAPKTPSENPSKTAE